MQSYTERCTLFSSTGGAKLQRKRRRKKCSSTGRSKLQSATPTQNNIHTLLCIQQDQTILKNSRINALFIITTQANNTTSTSSCSQQIQQIYESTIQHSFQTI
jgi:hypothetical protein